MEPLNLDAGKDAELVQLRADLAAVDEALGPKPWRTQVRFSDGHPSSVEPVECSRVEAIHDWIEAAGFEAREGDRLRDDLAAVSAERDRLVAVLAARDWALASVAFTHDLRDLITEAHGILSSVECALDTYEELAAAEATI
jgi:hypothetical protein